jgi:hypothetical protein
MTVMNTFSDSKVSQSWREMYEAVLFENDMPRLRLRIAGAERALMERACELFAASGNNSEEAQAVDNALLAASTLRLLGTKN